jgi:hypothetical protein
MILLVNPEHDAWVCADTPHDCAQSWHGTGGRGPTAHDGREWAAAVEFWAVPSWVPHCYIAIIPQMAFLVNLTV